MNSPALAPPPPRTDLLPLREGMRLSRRKFHRRYERMPGVRAELLGGTVHMPGPMKMRHHDVSDLLVDWLKCYRRATPGTRHMGGATAILSDEDEPQPDGGLWIVGRNADDYLEGIPELLFEVADATEQTDRTVKRRVYERRGVPEYLLVLARRDAVWWLVRDDEGVFVRMPPDEDGLLRSRLFPGLRLDAAALFDEDGAAVFAALDRGLGSPEHAAFRTTLADTPDPPGPAG